MPLERVIGLPKRSVGIQTVPQTRITSNVTLHDVSTRTESTKAPRAMAAHATVAVVKGDRIDASGAAQTHWYRIIGGRQVTPTSADTLQASRSFTSRYGRAPQAADRFETGRDAIDSAQNRYNAAFRGAAHMGPLSATVLKSQDYQESNLRADEPGGGIAQMDAAVAAKYGVRDIDDPAQAIPAQAAYERDIAKTLGDVYNAYGGDSKSPEFKKFVLGAYNAGMTTVEDAMRNAHDRALTRAKRDGAGEGDAHALAGRAATTWSALFDASSGKAQAPFYKAVQSDLPVDPAAKYEITKTYVDQILERSNQ